MKWDPVCEVQAVFRSDDLVLADPALIADLKIPASSKLFLTTIGLPSNRFAPFEWDMTLSKVDNNDIEALKTIPLILSNVTDLRRIGQESGHCPICICNDETGYVVGLNAHRSSVHVVNSSVQLLGGFCALYERYCTQGDSLHMKSFEPIARASDPRVFEDTGSLWPEVLEQIRDGLI